jgi:hypothetical protein
MTHEWDEFSKLLAEPVPRRDSLRRIGVVLAGAFLGPLGTALAASRGKSSKGKDPCQTFCKCRNKRQQNACLAACRACNGDTRRLCGACGNYHCADLASDLYNCGACGHVCLPPPPDLNKDVACINGQCRYFCIEGAFDCNGKCTFLDSDPDNCGACGNVCSEPTPSCTRGVCTDCERCGTPWCIDFQNDPNNCGACGVVCPAGYGCFESVCGYGGGPPPIPY